MSPPREAAVEVSLGEAPDYDSNFGSPEAAEVGGVGWTFKGWRDCLFCLY